jgi:hypothetical protein
VRTSLLAPHNQDDRSFVAFSDVVILNYNSTTFWCGGSPRVAIHRDGSLGPLASEDAAVGGCLFAQLCWLTVVLVPSASATLFTLMLGLKWRAFSSSQAHVSQILKVSNPLIATIIEERNVCRTTAHSDQGGGCWWRGLQWGRADVDHVASLCHLPRRPFHPVAPFYSTLAMTMSITWGWGWDE